MNAIKTYLGNWNITLAPGGVSGPILRLDTTAREFFLEAVTWNLRIFDMTNLHPVNIHLQEIILAYLCIGPVQLAVALAVGIDFAPLVAPAPSVADRRLYLDFPGQYFFKDLLFRENAVVWLTFTNPDPAVTYLIDTTLIIQINEECYQK